MSDEMLTLYAYILLFCISGFVLGVTRLTKAKGRKLKREYEDLKSRSKDFKLLASIEQDVKESQSDTSSELESAFNEVSLEFVSSSHRTSQAKARRSKRTQMRDRFRKSQAKQAVKMHPSLDVTLSVPTPRQGVIVGSEEQGVIVGSEEQGVIVGSEEQGVIVHPEKRLFLGHHPFSDKTQTFSNTELLTRFTPPSK